MELSLLYNVGLPFLSRHLLALSKAAHMTKAHSKVAHRGAQIAKKMWKKWRKDPESVPSLKAGRFARSVTMKSKYLAKRDLSKCGHALVPVEIDWSVLPDSAASSYKKLLLVNTAGLFVVAVIKVIRSAVLLMLSLLLRKFALGLRCVILSMPLLR